MTRGYQYAGVGLFFLFGLALIWGVFETLGETKLDDDTGYTVEARFADLKAVKVGDPVQVAGLRVGVVRDARLDRGRALVTFLLDEGTPIPADSVATIKASGVLGSSYVDILPGESERLVAPGSRLRTVETLGLNEVAPVVADAAVELQQTLSGLQGLQSGEDSGAGLADGVAALATLGEVLEENRASLRAIAGNLEAVTGRLARGEGTAGRLLTEEVAYDELVALLGEARGAVDTFAGLGEEARGLLADLRAGEGAAGLLLADEATEARLRAILENVDAFARNLNDPDSTLGRLLTDDALYRELRGAIDGVQDAVGALDETGPVTAAGVVGGALF